MEELNDHDSWNIAHSYFRDYGLIASQMDSYNRFINPQGIEEIIRQTGPIDVRSDPNNYTATAPPCPGGHRSQGRAESLDSQFCGTKRLREEAGALGGTKKLYAGEDGEGRKKLRYRIEFGKVTISRPTVSEKDGIKTRLMPKEARLRRLTYSSRIYVSITKISYESGDCETETSRQTVNLNIGQIPVMIGSDRCNSKLFTTDHNQECVFDPGGYFIVNGNERVLVSQERKATNKVLVFCRSNGTHVTEIVSVSPSPTKPPITTYIRTLWKKEKLCMHVNLPFIRGDIPVFLLMRALGVPNDRILVEYSTGEKVKYREMIPSMLSEANQFTLEGALDWIGRRISSSTVGSVSTRDKRIQNAKSILSREFFSHIGVTEDSCKKKAILLGYAVKRTLGVIAKDDPPHDRDHLDNKRLDVTGPLFSQIFRLLYRKLQKDIRDYIVRCINTGKNFNLVVGVRQDSITRGIKYCVSTGLWAIGRQNFQKSRCGVSQILNRMNVLATFSHLKRVDTGAGKDGKSSKPRQLHNSQFGMNCPAETPEGQPCGLVKAQSVMQYTSDSVPNQCIINILLRYPSLFISISDERWKDIGMYKSFVVVVGGIIEGIAIDGPKLYTTILQLRRAAELSQDVGIRLDYDLRELRFNTDAGRYMRPLLIVENGNNIRLKKDTVQLLTERRGFYGWADLVASGFVEFVDVDEEDGALICMFPRNIKLPVSDQRMPYTHCEIHPCLTLGVCASTTPFPDHNQSPRNTYSAAMSKQAIGMYCTNYMDRIDTISHIPMYTQKPLVTTKVAELCNMNTLGAGQEAIVAVYCGAYNQEDSLLIKRSFIERGGFRTFTYRSFTEEERKMGTCKTELFECPNKKNVFGFRLANYDKIEKDGFPTPGTRISQNDVIVGKTVGIVNNSSKRRDVSVMAKKNETGTVEKVSISTSVDTGMRQATVKVRQMRTPEIGDKFSSRHGQKGTIGMVVNEEDMYYTRSGMTPDIVMNPHAIPSRMTIGQVIECIAGKAAVLTGEEADGTAFNKRPSIAEIGEILHANGFQKHGNERMYNGTTGRMVTCQIFIGPVYYERLRHMVVDKIHSRATGKKDNLVRQPLEGRAKDGGLRFGEMEKDCMISHGASSFLKERMLHVSDEYNTIVCSNCGMIIGDQECKSCEDKQDRFECQLPYAAKLLFQELICMGIMPRIHSGNPNGPAEGSMVAPLVPSLLTNKSDTEEDSMDVDAGSADEGSEMDESDD